MKNLDNVDISRTWEGIRI